MTIKRGLAEGDRVVTSGNFLIDSESRMKPAAVRTVNEKRNTSGHTSPMSQAMQASTSDPCVGCLSIATSPWLAAIKKFIAARPMSFARTSATNNFCRNPRNTSDDQLRSAANPGSGHGE